MALLPIAILTSITLLAGLFTLVAYRFNRILDPLRHKNIARAKRRENDATHLLIVLGSGGHTAEMIAMLDRAVTDSDPAQRLQWSKYTHRTWVVSSGDTLSAQRAKAFEERAWENTQNRAKGKAAARTLSQGTYNVCIVPRAREIHQPLYTAPFSSLRCMQACYRILMKVTTGQTMDGKAARLDAPDLIMCNGPATATILIFTSILMRFFDIRGSNSRGKMRTIYVESWARVKKLSLSGTLLSRVVDRFLVQWPQLEMPGGRPEYVGVLV